MDLLDGDDAELQAVIQQSLLDVRCVFVVVIVLVARCVGVSKVL